MGRALVIAGEHGDELLAQHARGERGRGGGVGGAGSGPTLITVAPSGRLENGELFAWSRRLDWALRMKRTFGFARLGVSEMQREDARDRDDHRAPGGAPDPRASGRAGLAAATRPGARSCLGAGRPRVRRRRVAERGDFPAGGGPPTRVARADVCPRTAIHARQRRVYVAEALGSPRERGPGGWWAARTPSGCLSAGVPELP